MPPKKNKTPTTEKKTPEKVVKKKVAAVKPKLKVPTVVKIKIPSSQSLTKPASKSTKKQLTAQVKLDLANEVAKAQLVKPITVTPIIEEPVKTVKRRAKKKVVSDFFYDADAPPLTDPPKRNGKVNKSKVTEDSEIGKKPIAAPKKRESTTGKTKSAKKPKTDTSKAEINNDNTIKNKEEITGEQPQELVVPKSKVNVRQLRSRQVKGKVDKSDDVPADNTPNSPSILQSTIDDIVSPTKAVNVVEENAVPIESRKTSVTSNSSLSWTKDISSSSTTTCVTVTSNDFVRFNRKLPVISLTNVALANGGKRTGSLSVSSSSSEPETRINTSEIDESLLEENSHLHLSTSSLSILHTDSTTEIKNNVTKIGAALNELSARLKNFDSEIMNWIGYENESNNGDARKYQDNIIEVFKAESEVIMHCRQIKKVLAEETDKRVGKWPVHSSSQNSRKNINFDETIAEDHNMTHDDFDSETHCDSENDDTDMKGCDETKTTPVNVRIEVSTNDKENVTGEKNDYVLFDHNDDDDALSLFAESISGLESSRMNTSMPSTSSVQHEEYIPEPIIKECESPEKVVYCPTKIDRTANDNQSTNGTLCDKYSDSTSIKESQAKSIELRRDNIFAAPKRLAVSNDHVKNLREISTVSIGDTPCLMASLYKRLHGPKSTIFKGVCFFYLISSCKNLRCSFPHLELDIAEIQKRLVRLTEILFIQEYMLMRNWPTLRRKYGMIFLEECKRRDLTRILIEMSIDCIMKANINSKEDALLKTEAVESTLLYLNAVNLNDFKDLLMFKFFKNLLLCDVYMQVIADTQNFSRFKLVFHCLIQFMIDNGRTFKLSVSEHILERVSILPYEEPLIRAVVNMIRNTDTGILQNSMLHIFEKHVANVGVEFYEEFVAFKKEASMTQPVLVAPYVESPSQLRQETVALNNGEREREKNCTSPEPTDLNGSEKVPEEPIITRIININPSLIADDFRPKNNFKSWKNKSIIPKMLKRLSPQMNGLSNRRSMTPPANLQMNQRHVSYRTSPTVYTRRSIGDF